MKNRVRKVTVILVWILAFCFPIAACRQVDNDKLMPETTETMDFEIDLTDSTADTQENGTTTESTTETEGTEETQGASQPTGSQNSPGTGVTSGQNTITPSEPKNPTGPTGSTESPTDGTMPTETKDDTQTGNKETIPYEGGDVNINFDDLLGSD